MKNKPSCKMKCFYNQEKCINIILNNIKKCNSTAYKKKYKTGGMY